MEKITSLQNPKIKEIVALRKAGRRKGSGLIIVEGRQEINMALKAGFAMTEIFVCPELASPGQDNNWPGGKRTAVSKPVFAKISLRENPDGLLSLFKPRDFDFKDLPVKNQPLFIVLEAVEKPGNLGAILRTAEAAGVDGVIVCSQKTDIYNPNVIRASLGAVFTVPAVTTDNNAALAYLRKHKIAVYAALIDGECDYFDADLSGPAAFVIGTEHEGLSRFWADNADQRVKIPMCGRIDSLNASVSAAILIYETVRQRRQRIDKSVRK